MNGLEVSETTLSLALLAAWATLLALAWLIARTRRAWLELRSPVPHCEGCGRETPWPVRACDACPVEVIRAAYSRAWKCDQGCGRLADGYAMDLGCAGGWGGRYCDPCAKALHFTFTDRYSDAA